MTLGPSHGEENGSKGLGGLAWVEDTLSEGFESVDDVGIVVLAVEAETIRLNNRIMFLSRLFISLPPRTQRAHAMFGPGCGAAGPNRVLARKKPDASQFGRDAMLVGSNATVARRVPRLMLMADYDASLARVVSSSGRCRPGGWRHRPREPSTTSA